MFMTNKLADTAHWCKYFIIQKNNNYLKQMGMILLINTFCNLIHPK